MRVTGPETLTVNKEIANTLAGKTTATSIITVEFKLNEEKKHSVRYDASSDDPAVTSAYVMKKDLPKPYPKKFKMQLIFE